MEPTPYMRKESISPEEPEFFPDLYLTDMDPTHGTHVTDETHAYCSNIETRVSWVAQDIRPK